jgi:hypothetical protein
VGGSIAADGVGEAAITVNSNNDVTNNGTLSAVGVDNTGGVHILDGFSGTITNTGGINFTDGYVLADSDNDGDLDGAFATGMGRYGIMLDAGSFTGNITNSGDINVEGNGSYGILLNGLLDGDGTTTGHLTSTAAISVIGDNSVGIAIEGGVAGGVAGDVIVRGGVSALGEGASGLVVNAEIGGELRLNGAWTVTGFHSTSRPTATSQLDPGDDDLIGGPAIAVHYSVAGGITLEGIGQVDDPDDDGDGITEEDGDTNDDRTVDINSYGSAPALWIAADPSADLALGPTSAPGGYGLHILGDVTGRGVQDGVEASAIRIEGLGGSNVTTAAGVNNEGTILSLSHEADSTALFIGANADVPTISNVGSITAQSTTELASQAHGILIDSTATGVNAIVNSGTIQATVIGALAEAVAIRDESGTLSSIDNTGSIFAQLLGANGVPVTETGTRIAIDVSNSVSGVTITQAQNANVDIQELIQGDILFGSGGDTIDLSAGTIRSNISFGAGADQFTIDGGALYEGILSDGDDDLTLDIINGTLHLTGGAVTISDANFGADSILGVTLSGDVLDPPVITALGTVTFDSGAEIDVNVPGGLIEATQIS